MFDQLKTLFSKPIKQVVTLDFETYYGPKYTLTSLTYLEYIKHPEFYIQGFSYSINFGKPTWVPPSKVEETLRSLDLENSALLCQNTHFDASIMKWVFGIEPMVFLDTMLMGRQVIYGSTSLDALTKALFPNDKSKWKGKELVQFKGIKILDEQQESVMAGYCNQDVYCTNNVFLELIKYLPDQELRLIDMTLRMAYAFNLQANIEVLTSVIDSQRDEKQEYIDTFGETTLRSNQKFAELLRTYGIEPPMKESPTTGKITYAFSKNDLEFKALLDDPITEALIKARMTVKSNILETRAQRFIDCQVKLGYLPIFLNYAGARNTARWSGGQKMNPQNLSRGSNLRRAIEAPPGYVLVVCDLSQIENRVLAWICGFLEALLKFADPNYDPYIDFATKLYDVPAAQVQKHQRQVAKAGVLGLGYGMGWRKFILFAKLLTGIDVSEEEAKRVVAMYRTTNSPISRFWDLCQEALIGMANDPNMHYSVRGITFGYKHVMKPNGTFLNYHNLKYYVDDKDESKNGFMYGGEKGNWKYIYGGLLTENLVQSLARDIIADQAVRINDKYGYEPAHMVHDELIYVLPVDEAEQAYVKIQAEMCIPPDWCSDIPLNAEGGVAANYGEAK